LSSTAPVVETVSRKRIIPPAELEKEKTGTGRTTPEFWEYLESMTPDMWASDYLLYILREDPKPSLYGGTNTIEKCPGYIAMPDGTKQPLNCREDVELAIRQKYGGRAFRLILKKANGERVSEGKCMNESMPKYPDPNLISAYHGNPLPGGIASQLPPQQQSETNAIASKAIDAVTGQQPEALRLAMDVLRSASEIVMRQAPPPVTAPSTSLIDQTIIQTLIHRALEPPPPPPPPPDPFEMFLKFKELIAPPASNGVKETLDLITTLKNSNLIGAPAGKSTLLDLGREVIPAIASTARDAIHEWRLGVEAQVRGVEITRGSNPPPPPTILQPPAVIEPSTAAAPPPAAPVQTAPSGEPPFDWLAIKIVEILRDQSYTVDEAVDEALSFLYRAHAPAVPLLLDPPKLNAMLPPGEQGLLMLFQNHPVLKQVPVNPRLVEFIRKFIAAAKEGELESAAPGAPPAATPPPA
jgi:hypothetical protein